MQMSSLPLLHVQLRAATRTDPVLGKVLLYIKKGWTGSHAMQESCKQYWRRREELTVEADCILLGTRVVVPTKLREVVLQKLHKGHQGVARMKARARSQVWWPGLDHEIEQLARCCSACVNVKSVPPHCMLHPWVWPT